LLPLALEGIFVGAPPAQDAFSPLLLSVQGLESCCQTGDAPLGGKRSCCTPFYGKDAERGGREGREKRRATGSAAEDGLLQLLYLLKQVDGVEGLRHLSQLLLLLGRQDA
jgi:hypothetical protein